MRRNQPQARRILRLGPHVTHLKILLELTLRRDLGIGVQEKQYKEYKGSSNNYNKASKSCAKSCKAWRGVRMCLFRNPTLSNLLMFIRQHIRSCPLCRHFKTQSDLHDWIETKIREGVIDQEGNLLTSSSQIYDPSPEFQAQYEDVCEYYHHQLGYGRHRSKADVEQFRVGLFQYRNEISEEAAAKPISQQAEEFVDDYYQLPPEIVEEVINSTFQAQTSEAEWITVGPRKSRNPRRPGNSTAKGRSSRKNIPEPSSEQEVMNSLEALQIKNREKNRKRNEKRKMKKQMEDAAAAEAPQQLSAVQRLQQLIDELDEYVSPRPSDKPTLDQYIPWDEIERKRRLRDSLLHVQHEALQEEDLPPSPSLSLFNGDVEITMEQLDSMFNSFSCYMVFIPPPKELQTPTSDTTAQAGDKPTTLVYQRRPPDNSNRHLKKDRGRHKKAASSTIKDPDKIILFHGEEAKPLPEPQIRADSYIFDPSDEEGGLPDKASQSEDKNSSPYASSNEPDNVPPLPNEKLLAPISQKKPVKSKELSGSSSRESSHLDQIRSEVDDKILQQLKSLPVNITVTGISVALQSFNPPGPGHFDLTGVYYVPNIVDKIHPTLLLDSHAKGRPGMLLQCLSNNLNRRWVRGIHQCRYSANKEFPTAVISKMRGWLHPCGPSYTMLRESTNLQGRRAVLVRIWHSICPRKEISSKEKAVSETKLVKHQVKDARHKARLFFTWNGILAFLLSLKF
ncbi:hypothetical protein Taro_028089 [Colocasia esculenta]|uniref:Uncharacterized protein n=1 Tax=Colocasia esculenta TaxID=4460 RepID=A0A843VK03_COLES|nr:hypothetical protein [Colocasia esculenta]